MTVFHQLNLSQTEPGISSMVHDGNTPPERPAILGGPPVRPQGPPDWPVADPRVREALEAAWENSFWGRYHGPNCEELAVKFAEYHGCEQAVLCASGTAAVELALRGLKVGPGDEVILAAYDFKGNFQNVLTVGATPVLVDLRPDNWNLNVALLEDAISERTKAVIATHLHGGVVPMPQVMEIAARRGVAVIEDACQMPGALIEGRKAGTWGDAGVFSFGGSKLLSAGRGGALITDRAEIVQRARLYSHRGNEAYPLSELQAAVLIPQLEQLDERNRVRAENVRLLSKHLAGRDGLFPFENYSDGSGDSTPGYYKLGFRYDPALFSGLSRKNFAQAMRAEGIALDAGFRALHRIHSARRFRQCGELSQADRADEGVLVLHHPVLLEGETEMEQIVAAVEKIRAHAAEIIEAE